MKSGNQKNEDILNLRKTIFSIVFAFLLLLVSGISITFVADDLLKNAMKSEAEDLNATATAILMNSLSNEISTLLSHDSNSTDAINRTDKLVKHLLNQTLVHKVKVYNMQKKVLYSSEKKQIGDVLTEEKSDGYDSARKGNIYSELTYRDKFTSFEKVVEHLHLVSSYIPVRNHDGNIIGIFEIYQDVTPHITDIQRKVHQIEAVIAIVLSLIFITLFFTFQYLRGIELSQRRQLLNNNRHLDTLVANRTKALSESKKKVDLLLEEQRIVFDNAQIAIMLVKDDKIIRANPFAAELFELTTPSELEGMDPKTFLPGSLLLEEEFHALETDITFITGKSLRVVLSRDKTPDGHFVWGMSDVTSLRRAEAEAERLSTHDQLTGLHSRKALLDASADLPIPHTLIVFDLDGFQPINDAHGHLFGDLILKKFADRLRHLLPCAFIARIGADEFAAVIEHSDSVDYALLFSRISTNMNQPYESSEGLIPCKCSVGLCCPPHANPVSPADSLRRADLALFKAKQAGGGQICMFEPSMETDAIEAARLDSDMRHAISDKQFSIHLQPQVDKFGNVQSCEALLRWNHPVLGNVPPSLFIPRAEKNGLINELGQFALYEACKTLAKWKDNPVLSDISIAVNVSSHQFMSENFTQMIYGTLLSSGASPERLKLELTESVLADDHETVVSIMTELELSGITFSLDDFGTGFSSLSYLSRLPLDQLKIDKSFVTSFFDNDRDAAICEATISLARSLKLRVVAEGVETQEQHDFLTVVHDCDLIQGYFYSKPLPINAFEEFVLLRVGNR